MKVDLIWTDGVHYQKYKNSKCSTIADCYIEIYERWEHNKFGISVIFSGKYRNLDAFTVHFPDNINNLLCAKRQAPNIIKREIAQALRKLSVVHRTFLNQF